MSELLADEAVLFDFYGISRVADQTDLDVLGVPVWAAIRPAARSLSVASGKGLTHSHARISAIMEGIETACAEHSERLITKKGSINDLEAVGYPILPLDRLQKRLLGELDLCRERGWVRGELLSGSEVWAPYEIVGLDERPDAPWDREAFQMSSVGLAAHSDREAAVTAALLEAVEEDAVGQVMVWPGQLGQLDRINALIVDDPELADLQDRTRRAGLAPTFLDATSDLCLPVAICVLREIDVPHSRIRPFAGTACRVRMKDAMVAALLEAIQSRATDIAGARDDIRLANFGRRGGETPEIGGPKVTLPQDGPVIGSKLVDLAGYLEGVGFGPVAVFDLSHPRSEIFCTAVVVPGLEAGGPEAVGRIGPRTRRRILSQVWGTATC